ncbi:MAG: glycosyltransferase [Symploca sp. SIO3C6]|uniref:Glycosyltransferase n=1 Tax=Symploca sp. SIO1C4 TaxID=2607765 RepID=A0A6B3N9J9_9CYAN|nr:glycosyltransferase [Symploca sp. SIO3C6]NER27272.1 glycosyltransferase [Symploca sp. SIO1C4]
MDCIIPTHDRPIRLACTLSSLLSQQLNTRKLYIVDNSVNNVCQALPVQKMLNALRFMHWEIKIICSKAKSITEVKLEALHQGNSPYLVLLDNDVVFTRADTIKCLEFILEEYEVSAVSPVAYDVDGDRAVLTPYISAYDRYAPDVNGVLEGTVALGACIALTRSEVEEVLNFWKWTLPYMEDQVLIHFLKTRGGYAFLRNHTILHCGYRETPSYYFNDDEVINHLEDLVKQDVRYLKLLELRRELKDGADFPRKVIKKISKHDIL